MKKPLLVILAAGIGSRYGGLKQIDPVDSAEQLIIDYSIYDAKQAGFEKVVCIITPALEENFRERIGDRISKHVDLHYAYQTLEKIPAGFSIPEGRTKPWGTAHATLCAKHLINSPFAVINADDFYGRNSFVQLYSFLSSPQDPNNHAMVSFLLENTLTEHGHVARGVCKTEDNQLVEIIERTHIEPRSGGAVFTEDGENFTFVPQGTVVSMNFWGFQTSIISDFENRLPVFLTETIKSNPLKGEYLLPTVVNELVAENQASVNVLKTTEKWFGVTYKDDMPKVRQEIAKKKSEGIYPDILWG
jgi:dTDP-glucose pyrophosphorylase